MHMYVHLFYTSMVFSSNIETVFTKMYVLSLQMTHFKKKTIRHVVYAKFNSVQWNCVHAT